MQRAHHQEVGFVMTNVKGMQVVDSRVGTQAAPIMAVQGSTKNGIDFLFRMGQP